LKNPVLRIFRFEQKNRPSNQFSSSKTKNFARNALLNKFSAAETPFKKFSD